MAEGDPAPGPGPLLGKSVPGLSLWMQTEPLGPCLCYMGTACQPIFLEHREALQLLKDLGPQGDRTHGTREDGRTAEWGAEVIGDPQNRGSYGLGGWELGPWVWAHFHWR